jgi:hypothetical protein
LRSSTYWVEHLKLEPHPEGGYFKELFRSEVTVPDGEFSGNLQSKRSLYTSIYFLLEQGTVSRFHRLKSDEIWYYHYGDSMIIECIKENGEHYTEKLGPDVPSGEKFQVVIPAGTIFGAKTNGQNKYSLVGCLVSPGFDFHDFQLFESEELLRLYPGYKALISEFT